MVVDQKMDEVQQPLVCDPQYSESDNFETPEKLHEQQMQYFGILPGA